MSDILQPVNTKNTKTMSEALDAIHEECEKLLATELPQEIAAKVELIMGISRYKTDIRTEQEASCGPTTERA